MKKILFTAFVISFMALAPLVSAYCEIPCMDSGWYTGDQQCQWYYGSNEYMCDDETRCCYIPTTTTTTTPSGCTSHQWCQDTYGKVMTWCNFDTGACRYGCVEDWQCPENQVCNIETHACYSAPSCTSHQWCVENYGILTYCDFDTGVCQEGCISHEQCQAAHNHVQWYCDDYNQCRPATAPPPTLPPTTTTTTFLVQWTIGVVQGEGSICVSWPGSGAQCAYSSTGQRTISVPYGANVLIHAEPLDSYYTFDHFGGSGGSYYSNDADFIVEGGGNIFAYFEPATVYWTITVAQGEGSIGVFWIPYLHQTTTSKEVRIPYRVPVDLIASPADGYEFHHFGGAGGNYYETPVNNILPIASGIVSVYFVPEEPEPVIEEVTQIFQVVQGKGQIKISYQSGTQTITNWATETQSATINVPKGTWIVLDAYPATNYVLDRFSSSTGGDMDVGVSHVEYPAEGSGIIYANFVPATIDLRLYVTQGKGTTCMTGTNLQNQQIQRCANEDSSTSMTVKWGTSVAMSSTGTSNEYFTWTFDHYGGVGGEWYGSSSTTFYGLTQGGDIYTYFKPATVDWLIVTSPPYAGSTCIGSYCTDTSIEVPVVYNTWQTLRATENPGYTFKYFLTNTGNKEYNNPASIRATGSGTMYAMYEFTGCNSDADCAYLDCSTDGFPGGKPFCDLGRSVCSCGACSTHANCLDGWCCDINMAGGSGYCKQANSYYTVGGYNRYVCDPMESPATVLDWILSVITN